MGGATWARATLAVVVVWVAAIVFMAFQPQTDYVPTGVVNNAPTNQAVHCPAAFGDDSAPTIPDLPPGRSYQRAPCETLRRDFRWVVLFDVALGLAAISGLTWLLVTRSGRTPELDAPAAVSRTATPAATAAGT